MTPHHFDGTVALYHGDALDVLANLADGIVDAVVTDPPYELGFMGKAWDGQGIAYNVELWKHALRVLKPGGHLLAFGGTRTHHRLACAIEDAGFELRDSIAWLYGSGFPKSLDVSKAIDKARRRDYVLAAIDLGLTVPGNNLHDWTKAEHSPGDAWWERFKEHLSAEQWGAIEREVIGARHRKATGRMAQGEGGYAFGEDFADTAPATDDARRWAGWGTALKPAHEPIVVARKPLAGNGSNTVAANVLAHGTGALNIDATRVGHASVDDLAASRAKNPGRTDLVTSDTYGASRPQQSVNDAGRWPTNVLICDDHAAELGEAGRYFPTFKYQAKAPTKERPKVNGVAHPTVKPLALMQWLVRLVTPPGGVVLDPFAGSGTTAQACVAEGFRCITVEREPTYLPLILARLDIDGSGRPASLHGDAPAGSTGGEVVRLTGADLPAIPTPVEVAS